MTKMDWFNIITGIAGICGALSWIPIVLDKIKQREVKASLIHCRFFDRFSYPILPPDYVGQQLNSKDVTFDKYEGALIVVGINICSTNKDFVVDKVKAVLSMDKSEIEAILVSPDVILPYLSNQDNAVTARFYIPSSMDISKMKNIHANVNTRLYMAFICKDVNEIKYSNFKNLQITLTDIDGKNFIMNFNRDKVHDSSLITDRDIYDVDYKARNSNRQIMELLVNSPMVTGNMNNLQNNEQSEANNG